MVDVDEFELAPDRDLAPTPPPGSRRRAHAWPWVTTAAALVLVGSVCAEPVLLTGPPGLVVGVSDVPAAAEPAMVWTTELDSPAPMGLIGSTVVVGLATATSPSSQHVLGLDLETGAERWRHPDPHQRCHPTTVVTCVVDPGSPDAQVVTIDAATGEVTERAHPGAVGAVATDDGLVVVETTGSVPEDVVLVEPDGAERWRVQADAADESDPPWAPLSLGEGTVRLGFEGVGLDLSSGEARDASSSVIGGAMVEMVDDRVVIHVDGRSATLEPDELPLMIDDSVGAGAALVQRPDGGLSAQVRGTGEQLWQLDGSCFPQVRLRGRVVVGCWSPDGAETVGIDEVSGDAVWRVDSVYWVVAATGDTLVVVDDASGVLGVDPTSGDVRWAVETQGPAFTATLDDAGGLLVSDESGLTRLVWD
ncbi:outer membrane protein assembly factor BamB family protein [Actinotalea caeni]|uniref:outer membrane protein assembly factor BamB family protein n=1 Tax=Actinotalea caeni TaxID=1348467 RepID=UPI0012E2151B|nr:PQQ-binding-like beta-propeller repeat protein [Actinotalea caeni]